MIPHLRDATIEDSDAIVRLNDLSVAVTSPMDADRYRELLAISDLASVVELEGEVAAFLLTIGEGRPYDNGNYHWFSRRLKSFLYIDRVVVEGIHRVSLTDITHAADMGYRIKLLGAARMNEGGLEMRMQPCLVPADSALGQLEGVTNMVVVEGDFVGRIVMQGPGAGAGPTASAIMADVVDIARGLVMPVFGRPASIRWW